MRRLALLVSLSVVAVFAIAGSAFADISASTPETLLLDTHVGTAPFAGPVTTSDILTNTSFYVVTVSGTYSVYHAELWDPANPNGWRVCGTPEAHPMTPSPGQPDVPAGQDADTSFARPWQKKCTDPTTPTYPHHETNIRFNLGSGIFRPVAQGGPFATPQPGHSYTYLVQGLGTLASFSLFDTQLADNNGVLTINIRTAGPSDCGSVPGCPGPPPPPPPPAAGAGPSVTGGGPSKNQGVCVSRRVFRIRIPSRRADPVVSAVMQLNGKKLASRRVKIQGKKRVTAIVDFRGLKTERRSVLKIIARLRSGKRQLQVRVYHTCTSKRLTRLSVTPRHDRTLPFRFHVVGRVTKPTTRPNASCTGGKVQVLAHIGKRLVGRRTVTLKRSCRFNFTQTLVVPQSLRGKLITYRALFQGTKTINRSQSWPVTVKAG